MAGHKLQESASAKDFGVDTTNLLPEYHTRKILKEVNYLLINIIIQVM